MNLKALTSLLYLRSSADVPPSGNKATEIFCKSKIPKVNVPMGSASIADQRTRCVCWILKASSLGKVDPNDAYWIKNEQGQTPQISCDDYGEECNSKGQTLNPKFNYSYDLKCNQKEVIVTQYSDNGASTFRGPMRCREADKIGWDSNPDCTSSVLENDTKFTRKWIPKVLTRFLHDWKIHH